MNITLRAADGHHIKAKALYRDYLLSKTRKAGAVLNLAAITGIPVRELQKGLDENCEYTKLRNLAHEVMRKLPAESKV